MKKLRVYALAACTALTLFSFTDAYANKPAEHASYSAARKLGRGLAGMTTGVLELPGNVVKETRARGAIGLPIGLATGLGMTVTRELVGVYEFLSTPFPVPSGFRPILTPEYPWDYFE
ncbi:MAG: exosortase system-associated protein, TIGR04073 family [Methylobacter sp.]